MKTVGITGGIGSGKSTLCRMLENWGVPVYEADARTKALYGSDPELIPALETALQTSLRAKDGSLDRRRLARILFDDAQAREQVEVIVHPKVLADFLAWKAELPEKDWTGPGKVPFVAFESAIVLEKPLFVAYLDKVVWVEAPERMRMDRTVARDGCDEMSVRARMASQRREMALKADAILPNDGDLATLERRARRLFEAILTENE